MDVCSAAQLAVPHSARAGQGGHLLGIISVPGGGSRLEDGAGGILLWRLQPGVCAVSLAGRLAAADAIGTWLGCQLGLCQCPKGCSLLTTSTTLKSLHMPCGSASGSRLHTSTLWSSSNCVVMLPDEIEWTYFLQNAC